MGTVYLVTGASGHLGSHICRMLVERGERVRGFVLPGDPCPALAGLSMELISGDVRDPGSLDALFHAFDDSGFLVFHAAGIVQISRSNRDRIRSVNVEGTANVIEACRRHGARRLLYTSSVHALPEKGRGETVREADGFSPHTVTGLYAQTKAEATQLVLDAARRDLDALFVHPSGIIGPGDFLISHTTQLIMDYFNGRLPAGVRGGHDFVDVRDVAAAAIAAMDRGQRGSGYILSNRYLTVAGLFDILHDIHPGRRIRLMLPLGLARAAAPLLQFTARLRRTRPLYTAYSLAVLQAHAVYDHSRATKELDFNPRPLEETLRDTVRWLKEQGRISLR